MSSERLGAHLEALTAEGYQALALSEASELMATSKALPPRPVVITFDDGFLDFLTAAVPLLNTHAFPATLYVTTGYLGETSRWLADVDEQARPMLDFSDLPVIAEAGIEIGAHGHSHAMLDLLPDDVLLTDIQASRDILGEAVGHRISSFAYPHGYSNASVRRATRAAGFETACAVHNAMSSGLSEEFEIPRIIVEHDTDVDALLAKLRGIGLQGDRFRHSRASIWRARRSVWRSRHRALASTLGT